MDTRTYPSSLAVVGQFVSAGLVRGLTDGIGSLAECLVSSIVVI
jgi:hypothetical protein